MKIEGPKEPRFSLAGWVRRIFREPIKSGRGQRYIENQEEHHRKMTFQDELRALLRRHGIAFDERFVWD